MTQNVRLMRSALRLAKRGLGSVEPNPVVGAIIVKGDKVIGRGRHKKFGGPHAEINALEDCKKSGNDPRGAQMYVTLEPCCMCAGALVLARMDRLVYGCDDPKTGAVRSLYNIVQDERLNHRLEVTGGVLSAECSELLQEFFQRRRIENKNQ